MTSLGVHPFAYVGQTKQSFSQGASVYYAVDTILRADVDFTLAELTRAVKCCNERAAPAPDRVCNNSPLKPVSKIYPLVLEYFNTVWRPGVVPE